jgi:hypothetical protein
MEDMTGRIGLEVCLDEAQFIHTSNVQLALGLKVTRYRLSNIATS